ncbi:hypothetical protein CBR_g8134 [Chara braunii]|uniref:RNA-directed DNA polymerase n=1 Tax=Chara braunii TaxID=69332 RepID=A0A388KLA2_CHABU|nr:hypothetical protein CBR_g8134 [Chara braunii]|eukprot:GBG70834.1 hypothetical protein CBR_g8134 [Chara braunii]
MTRTMGDGRGEGEVQLLLSKLGRKGQDILPGGCDEWLLINLHPREPWLIFTPDRKSLLQVWNYEDGKQVASWVVPGRVNDVREAGFIPQRENWIAVRRWTIYEVYECQGSNLRRLTRLQTETGDSHYTWKMAVHQSLPCLLAGFIHKDFFLWHWSGKLEKAKFEGHNADVSALVFHPTEEQIFASASEDNVIKVWNLEKRSIIQTLSDDGKRRIYRMGFCGGGERSLLITSHKGDQNVRVWDYKKGSCIARWKAHDKCRASLFHPHLPYIMTAAVDGEIRVWSESSYQQVSSLSIECHKDGILSMLPSKIYSKLIVAGRGEFHVVEVETGISKGDQKKDEQEQKGSPCAKDFHASSSSMAVVVNEPAVVSRKAMEEIGQKVLVKVKLQLEEKIKEGVAMVEQHCKKAVDAVMAEHRRKERTQAEIVQQLQSEMMRTCESSKRQMQEVQRLTQRVQQLEEEIQTMTGRFETSKRGIQEVEQTLAEEINRRNAAEECTAHLAERICKLKHKLAEEVAKRERGEASLTHACDVCSAGTRLLKEYSFEELQHATDNFDVKRKFGGGDQFENTYLGTLRDGSLVTVRKVRDASTQLKTELVDRVRALRHPHLLTLVGVCYEGSCLVYEYMERGSLKDWISHHDEENAARGFLPWYSRFHVMAEVARALCFLHSVPSASGGGPIIHRAIKPTNILLSDSFVAKICGVDEAILDTDSAGEVQQGEDPLGVSTNRESRYIAPEYLHQRVRSEKMDIYAFGITVLEMLTGNLSNAFEVVEDAIEDHTTFKNALDRNAGCWDVDLACEVAMLGLRCASFNRRKRPDMTEPEVGILAVLEGVARKFQIRPLEQQQFTSIIVTLSKRRSVRILAVQVPEREGYAKGRSKDRGILFPGFKLGKSMRPREVLVASTLGEVGLIPSPLHEKAQANDSLVTPQTHPDQTMLCTWDVSEALEDLEGEWSNKDPRESWVALKKGPRGEHFVVEVDVGGRKCGAFIDIGSTWNYISRDCLERLHLQDRVRHLSSPVASTLANKERMIVTDYIKNVVCTFSYGGGELNHKISFLVSDNLPFDMLLGMYYLEVAKPQFDWDKKVLKHKLSDDRTVRLTKFKASTILDTYGCLCASAFYNYCKQNQEEGMYLVYVSEKGKTVLKPPEIERVVAKFPDLFEEPTGVVEREVDHAIEIIPGSKTPKGRIYRMAPAELDELRRQLKELTEKGWIRPSTSPYGSPVLFVPKKGGTLRMCIDYKGLNAIAVKNAEPLPRMDDLLDRVQGCKYYSKIDLKSGYHQIAIRPEDQHKTTFQTRYGLYEFVMTPFGLCNASGTFQHAMNQIFHDHLDKFVVVHLDDILIFSKSAEEHAQHVEIVRSLLRQHKYKVNLEKCEFGRTKILYLGHEVSGEGIRPEDAKVASIRDWPRPQTVTEKPFIVTIDASQYGIGAVLAQQDGKKLRPIEYMSKKMPSKKLAKSTYERELYALYKALVHWRHFLLGRFFYLRTDHQTLKWIKTQPALSDALKRWIEVIDQYDFKLEYLKGEYNKVADALSRRADYLGALVSDFGVSEEVTQSLVGAYQEDPVTMDIMRKLQAKDKATESEFVTVDGLLYLDKAGIKRLVVPSSEQLHSLFLGECHDATGHFGYKKTSANLVQRFWWPAMLDDAKKYVETCQVCQRDKPRTQAPLGLVKPLPIPAGPGLSVSMDFMDTLVTSKSGKRHIFVIIDRFTKYARLVAMPETARTDYVIKLFKDNWVRDFGLPKTIISDRDVHFTSELWKKTVEQMGSQLQMTSGNHPKANGQAEQMNRVVQHLLRHYIKPSQDDWDEQLPLIASLYNNVVHSNTDDSPNQLHLGWKPRSTLDFLLPENRPAATPGTLEYGVQYEKLLQEVVEHMKKAQQAMIASENQHRRQSSFKVGERVWVEASELGQEFRISRKLMPQYFGPWEVLDIVGDELDGPTYVIRVP